MKRLVLLTAFSAALAWAQPVAAGHASGQTLHGLCVSPSQYSRGFCAGYVLAIADALARGAAVDGWTACPPESVGVGRLRELVVTYMARRPESRHLKGESLVARALSEAFPCKR